MYKIYTIENYKAGTLIISNIDGLKRVVKSQKTDFLTVKLVDALKIEDFRIE